MDISLARIVVIDLQGGILVHRIADFLLQRGVRHLHEVHQLQRQRQANLPLDVLLL